MGHERLNVLKLDCEGCEWEVLADSQAWFSRVDQFVVELHFAADYQVATSEDVERVARASHSLYASGVVRVSQLQGPSLCGDGWNGFGEMSLVRRELAPLACNLFQSFPSVRPDLLAVKTVNK